jgi:hypothetical protein
MTTVARVLDIARSRLGITEWPPGSNRLSTTAWYGIVGPWCAMGVSDVFNEAGLVHLVNFQTSKGFHGCQKGLDEARRRGLVVSEPQPGDLVFFDWQGRSAGWSDHVGIVEKVNSDGTVTCIEGNTSKDNKGSQSNGGGWYRRVRTRGTICAFVRPAYTSASPAAAAPAAKPAPVRPARPGVQAPPYPLPRGYYFGPKDGPKASVSGFYSHASDLSRWQQQMRNRGWDIGVDGRYGDQTAAIARKFQSEKGLGVDGLIGPATWAAAWTAPVT